MSHQAKAAFKITTWNETPIHAGDGLPKLTRASVTQSLEGDITGQGTVEYLMSYRADGSASYVGIQRVVGTLAGRSGSFVLVGEGSYSHGKGEALMTWRVATGSGTGDLTGLEGVGSAFATHTPPGTLALTYELE
jgi:hypothetical protein